MTSFDIFQITIESNLTRSPMDVYSNSWLTLVMNFHHFQTININVLFFLHFPLRTLWRPSASANARRKGHYRETSKSAGLKKMGIELNGIDLIIPDIHLMVRLLFELLYQLFLPGQSGKAGSNCIVLYECSSTLDLTGTLTNFCGSYSWAMAKCIESIGSLGNSTGKHVTLPKKASPLDFRIYTSMFGFCKGKSN